MRWYQDYDVVIVLLDLFLNRHYVDESSDMINEMIRIPCGTGNVVASMGRLYDQYVHWFNHPGTQISRGAAIIQEFVSPLNAYF